MVEPVLIEKRQIVENITRINFFLYFSIFFQWTAATLVLTGNKCKNPNKKPLNPPKNHTSYPKVNY